MKNSILANYFRQLRQSPVGDKEQIDSSLSRLIGSERCDYIELLTERIGFFPQARNFGLECPLGQEDKRGDFFICLTRSQWGELQLPPGFAVDPAWQKIAAFGAWWLKAANQAAFIRDEVWLEFDLAKPPAAIPVPSFFFGVFGHEPQNYLPAVLAGLKALGVTMPASQGEVLARCLALLAPVCAGFQIGIMLSRPQAPLRLCAFSITGPDLKVIFSELGLSPFADTPDLDTKLCQNGSVFSAVDLDIGTGVGPKVGLEIDLSQVHSVREQKHSTLWPEFVNRLTKRDWITADKGAGVLAWPGGWRDGSTDDWLQGEPVLLRTISHIKLDFQQKAPPRAKAYLQYIIT
ncbi:hypothetical protein [Sporomusa malonica]|uniref:Uncharacterized protein n=1 Tax=Sporomusa malonica TaxID=112901 RepID=A0A1W2CW53_9FIRM|nr:hypothetical protein [Sporomusa malonica]SMC89463.1 hypothetical protein SAMN04488500_11228 [Sporomusa malonica]